MAEWVGVRVVLGAWGSEGRVEEGWRSGVGLEGDAETGADGVGRGAGSGGKRGEGSV